MIPVKKFLQCVQENADRIYHMAFGENEISFRVAGNTLTVVSLT